MATMNRAALGGVPYRVPPEPSRWRAITLAALVHAGLLLFLWAGISWQSTPPVAVEAEVWDMKVQSAAPPPEPQPQVEPEPAPPQKAVEPPVEKPVTPKPPDIALEKEKQKKKELQEKKLAEEKARKIAEEKAEQLAEQKRAEQAEADRKKAEKAEKLAKARQAAEEQKKLDKLHDLEMRRIAGAAGNTGSAAKATAPRLDSGYMASITAKIKGNTSYLGNTNVAGNPRAVFRIEELPTGEIISVKKVKSSGVPEFDDAVEKGMIKSSPLPKKKDGTVERSLEIGFSMKDLD